MLVCALEKIGMHWIEAEALEPESSSVLDLLTDAEAEPEGEEPDQEAVPSVSRLAARAARADWPALEPAPRLTLEPRVYQEDALQAWEEAGGRGVVVLPTGAGKTVLALMAIIRAGVRPLVIVPTVELL